MPLDVLGRTRATLMHSTSSTLPKGLGNLVKVHRDGDRLLQLLIFNEEFLVSAVISCVDYVPALCTHRPSLLPIEWSGEIFGLLARLRQLACGEVVEPYHLEEGEVVTRFP